MSRMKHIRSYIYADKKVGNSNFWDKIGYVFNSQLCKDENIVTDKVYDKNNVFLMSAISYELKNYTIGKKYSQIKRFTEDGMEKRFSIDVANKITKLKQNHNDLYYYHFLLRDILDEKIWNQVIYEVNYLNMRQYRRYLKSGFVPKRTKMKNDCDIITEQEAKSIIDQNKKTEDNVLVEVSTNGKQLKELCYDFYNYSLKKLKTLGNTDEIRVVFIFTID